MDNYGVLSYLDISTAHITKDILNGTDSIYRISSYPEGAFFWVPSKEDISLNNEEIPKELSIVFDFARERNCSLIRFDADGFEFPELPTYDWN